MSHRLQCHAMLIYLSAIFKVYEFPYKWSHLLGGQIIFVDFLDSTAVAENCGVFVFIGTIFCLYRKHCSQKSVAGMSLSDCLKHMAWIIILRIDSM